MSFRGVPIKKFLLLLGDSIVFFGSLYLALLIRRLDIFNNEYFLAHIPRFLSIYIFLIIIIFIAGLYEFPQFIIKARKVKYISYVVFAYIVAGIIFFYLFPSDYTPKVVLLIQSFILLIGLILWRAVADRIIKTHKKLKAILLDDSKEGYELRSHITPNDYPIDFVSHINVSVFDVENNAKTAFLKTIEKSGIDMIVADIKNEKVMSLLPHIYSLAIHGVKLVDLPNMYQYIFRKMPLSNVGYFWFFEQVSLDTKLYEFAKRVIDIIVSIPVIVIWLILHPWVAYMIKKEDGGEVFIDQIRLGRWGREIKIKKYRTMSFSDGGVWLGEKHNQNKVTNVGYFLRKTRIDELPQILNILKGDLSLVGPRADMIDLANRLEQAVPYYMIRYAVTPGLSGWAQTMMKVPPQTVEQSIERLQYDLYYIRHRSILLDIVIILRTIKTVLSREGM